MLFLLVPPLPDETQNQNHTRDLLSQVMDHNQKSVPSLIMLVRKRLQIHRDQHNANRMLLRNHCLLNLKNKLSLHNRPYQRKYQPRVRNPLTPKATHRNLQILESQIFLPFYLHYQPIWNHPHKTNCSRSQSPVDRSQGLQRELVPILLW